MASRPRRTLSPERAAAVHIYTIARRHRWTDPQGEERARTIAELQETAAPWPHLLAEHAGIFIGASQQTSSETEARRHLIAAQLLIEAGARLGAEARALFTTQERSGEGGELLLYTLLETVLRIPQILCKMPLKTSSEMHVHGTDGIHAKMLENGNLALYWGESKLHADVNSAIDDCLDSVAPYLLDAGGGTSERDLLLVRENLDAGATETTAALIRFFSQDTPEAAQIEVRAGCLVGFNLADYPLPYDESGIEVRREVTASIEKWYDRVGRRINHHLLHDFELEVFCVPVPSVDEFRQAIRRELGIGS